MMKLKRIAVLLISLILILTASIPSIADFGNFDTYDDGGGWGDSYGSDWGSSDWGNSSGNIYYYGDYSDYDGDEGDETSIIAILFVIALIVLISYIKFKNQGAANGGQRKAYSSPRILSYPNNNEEISAKIRENDPSFNLNNFISFANEVYVQLQNAWSERNLENVRHLLTSELYAQMLPSVEQYISLGKINVMERIGIQDSYLVSHSSDNQKEILTVYLYATQKDYIIDENTREILEGTDEDYRHSKYLVTFIRSEGTLTGTSNGIEANNCPNCGAPIELSAAGKCSYCGSIISNNDHSWVVSGMKRVN